jgi:LPXTG-motif cell wall-anchored protein
MFRRIINVSLIFLVSTSFLAVPVIAEEMTTADTDYSVSAPLAATQIVAGSVHYVAEDGRVLLSSADVSINSGSKFNWPVPAVIKGYEVDYSKSTMFIKASNRTQETSLQDFMTSVGLTSIEETILFLNNQIANHLAAESVTLTYVYIKTYEQAENVIIRYIDTEGNQLHDAQIINGYIGDSYAADTTPYKLTLDGYTLDETQLPQNAVGTLSDTVQTVTYIYKKDAATTGTVHVFYLDEAGANLAEPTELTGALNTNYTIVPKEINGYKVKAIQGNEAGTFTPEVQQVIYTYEKEKIDQQPLRTSDSSIEIPPASTSASQTAAKEVPQTSDSSQATVTSTESSQASPTMKKQTQLPRTNTRERQWYLIAGGSLLLLVGYAILKRRINYN